ncbi:hypothetical protein GCM10009754_61710 [Amycolatopsis minnesotensis]|uniref:Uncharacterized protein n=1 Tax=Amycolatopsis minnesotensis TaxID=337894 RepID=A0ABN2RZA0_9PSEU
MFDQHVDPAVGGLGALDRGADLFRIGDVERHRERPIAVRADEIGDLPGVAGGDHGAPAAAEDGGGQCPAESGGAAGDAPHRGPFGAHRSDFPFPGNEKGVLKHRGQRTRFEAPGFSRGGFGAVPRTGRPRER